MINAYFFIIYLKKELKEIENILVHFKTKSDLNSN